MEGTLKQKIKNLYHRSWCFYKNPKNKKIVFISLICLLIGLITPLRFIFAFATDPIPKSILFLLFLLVIGPIALLAFFVSSMAGLFIKTLTDTLIWSATTKIGGYSLTQITDTATAKANPFIKAGLDVTMPLANMIFILAFVTIAIATILGLEAYGIKKLLPVLIIMALLVNFAPVFVGLIVDAANVIVFYFVRGIGFEKLVAVDQDYIDDFIASASAGFGGTIPAAGFSQYLTWAVAGKQACIDKYGPGGCGELEGERGNLGAKIDKTCIKTKLGLNESASDEEIRNALEDKSEEGIEAYIKYIYPCISGKANPGILRPAIYLVGVAVAMILACGALMTMIALFLVRNLFIWLLVILAPLAFAARILPFTKQYFDKWWKEVIQWSFVGVAASFFLYLATVMLDVVSAIPIENVSQDELLGGIIALIIKVAFPVVLILIGLFAAVKSGGVVGERVVGGVKKIGKLTAVGTGAAIGYTALKGTEKGKGLFGKPGTKLYNWASKLEDSKWTPIKPGAITGQRPEEVDKQYKKWKPRYERLSKERLGAAAEELAGKEIGGHSTVGKRREARAKAILEQLSTKGVPEGSEAAVSKLAATMKNRGYGGLAEKLYVKNPSLVAGKNDQEKATNIDKLLEKTTRRQEIVMDPSAFKDKIVVQAMLKTNDVEKIGRMLSKKESADNFRTTLIQGPDPDIRVNVENNVREIAEKAATDPNTGQVDQTELTRGIDQIKNTLRNGKITRRVGDDLVS